MESLPEIFHRNLDIVIDAKGVYPHQMLLRDPAPENPTCPLTLMALDLTPEQVLRLAQQKRRENPARQIVFALDRLTQPGQGTTLGDVLTGAWWDGKGWKPFVVEYQHEPRIIKPMCWDNAHWNAVILKELRWFE